MKCLVLGGGGFLGSHLTDALLNADHAVRIFDRPNLRRYRAFRPDEAIEWMEGDFLDQRTLAEAAGGCQVIFHLVSTTLPRSSNDNPAYDVETNVAGSVRLLDAARRVGARKVIFVSSGGTVYGIPKEVPIRESHPTDPTCSYGICKLAIEKYLQLYQHLHGLDYCVLRLSNPFGERQRWTSAQGAVSAFLHRALNDEPIEIWGDGSVVRDYFYVGDAVSALVKAASYDGPIRLFNIGAGEGRSLNEVVAAIETLLGRPVRTTYLPGRAFDVPVNVLDIGQARTVLGWEPHTPFTAGLTRTLHWMKSDPVPST